jgi:predicted DNA-binding transcriptional regulator YafY
MEWLIALAFVIGMYLWTQRDRSFVVPNRDQLIASAIRGDHDIRMVYFTYSSRKFSTRTVTPLSADGSYMRARDHFRGDERTFKLARIKELSVVPRIGSSPSAGPGQ